jgi:PTH1 family peptidyl-tRNA hydrolase
MYLVVGLGNPGSEYARNRHNIGFMAADAIVRRHQFGRFRSKLEGELSQGDIAGRKILILKPMTYMNESGRSIGAALRFFKLLPAHLVVFHDEIDLAPGRVRVKNGGGIAGHNGLRSIRDHSGPDFRRVRLGVGHPGGKERVKGHVLQDFGKSDDPWLDKMLDAIAEYFPLIVAADDLAFMSKVAQAVNPPKPKPTAPEKLAGGENGDG